MRERLINVACCPRRERKTWSRIMISPMAWLAVEPLTSMAQASGLVEQTENSSSQDCLSGRSLPKDPQFQIVFQGVLFRKTPSSSYVIHSRHDSLSFSAPFRLLFFVRFIHVHAVSSGSANRPGKYGALGCLQGNSILRSRADRSRWLAFFTAASWQVVVYSSV